MRQGGKRGIWDEEGREKFRRGIGEKEREMEEEIEKMNERIKKVLEECGKGDKGRRRRKTRWWDKECIGRKKSETKVEKMEKRGRGERKV